MTIRITALIIQGLKEKGGMKVSELAFKNHVSRQIVYRSIAGNGSRDIRVKIATIIKTLPSLLWEKNPEEVKIIDDLYYKRRVK